MKPCSKCKVMKPYAAFNNRGDRDALRSQCRVCAYKKRPKRSTMSAEEKKASLKAATAKYLSSSKGKAKRRYYQAMRRALKLKATPKWLTKIQKEQILAHYETAQFLTEYLGQNMVVDHIIPLNGVILNGLHVPWNLQIMTHADNSKKSNKVEL